MNAMMNTMQCLDLFMYSIFGLDSFRKQICFISGLSSSNCAVTCVDVGVGLNHGGGSEGPARAARLLVLHGGHGALDQLE